MKRAPVRQAGVPEDPAFTLNLDTHGHWTPSPMLGEWNVVGTNVFAELLRAGFTRDDN